jgi:hypothetical protein
MPVNASDCLARAISVAILSILLLLPFRAISWQAEILDSSSNTFSAYQKINLQICRTGHSDTSAVVDVQVTDQTAANVKNITDSISLADLSVRCIQIPMPNNRLGYYRVNVQVNGISIVPGRGSRPPDYLTYAVVPDPDLRQLHPESDTFFGLQGAFNNHNALLLSQLGVRWVLGGYSWRQLGSDWAAVLDEKSSGSVGVPNYSWARTPSGKPWKTFTLPTLFMIDPIRHRNLLIPSTVRKHSGALNAFGESEWRKYCEAVARSYMRQYSTRKRRVYQITWEPVRPWGFAGAADDLVNIYRIAYSAIHKIDDSAFIIGPTGTPLNTKSIDWARSLFEAGLANYIDGFSIHPYADFPPKFPPELHGFIHNVKSIRSLLDKYKKNMPIFGTEQGYEAKATLEDELRQAEGVIRSNLILLGEGWQFNIAFYSHDFYAPNAGSTVKTGGYGFYYGLDDDITYGDRVLSPKPVAPAYAAMTFLLDGYHGVGPVPDLKGSLMGYIYERDSERLVALWDYGNRPSKIELKSLNNDAVIFDMMGNASPLQKSASRRLLIGSSPMYVRYSKDSDIYVRVQGQPK